MPLTFKLAVVSTLDGFIARYPGHAPHEWASAEEQDIFFREVDAADWSIMGRGTHEAANKPDRRRIIFTSQVNAPEWRRDLQVWLNPKTVNVDDLANLVSDRHRLENGLILGGTRIHDWFLAQNAIDEILMTIEPIQFGEGLPIFSDQPALSAEQIPTTFGFVLEQTKTLNEAGTRLLRFVKPD